MKTIKLVTYWNAVEAAAVLDFIDDLRTEIRLLYEDDIAEMYQAITEKMTEEAQVGNQFDDELDF